LRRISVVIPRLLLLLTLVTASSLADCIDNGHYTIAATTSPLTGGRYPYTEDLTHHLNDKPVGGEVTVAYRADGAWTKLQSGCASFDEKNISAAGPVNLLLRASIHLEYAKQQAPVGTRYEVQLRIGRTADDPQPFVAIDEERRLDGRYPQSIRFAAIARDLPAGNWIYSMWMRIIDGPPSNQITLDLQWITAQGVPNVYPAALTRSTGDVIVGTTWTDAAPPIEIDSRYDIDAILQSSFTIADASADAGQIEISFAADAQQPGSRYGVIALPSMFPDRAVVFDHADALQDGRHTIQLRMRATKGEVRLRDVRAECVSFPRRLMRPEIIPLQIGYDTQPFVATPADGDAQPASMSPVCGRWTKLLDMTLEPSGGPLSWTFEGFVEILGADVSGYGQLGIDVTHRERDRSDPSREIDYATDMGMFEFQAAPGRDGIYIFGDCSKWGNFKRGAHVSLWIRRIEGCNNAPFGGPFRVGQRWLSMKLLPSEGPHLP
jgi:hypothetical protein